MHFKHINTLGVINRTPNSFSCQGQSLEDVVFFEQLSTHLKAKNIISDVGFESTGPMNQAISRELEYKRFQEFLNKTKSCDFRGRYLSFDTYRPLQFQAMAHELKRYHPGVKLIFNDVSGVLDQELKETLLLYKGLDFYYIYNFNNIPSRTAVLDYDSFIDESSPIINQCVKSFARASEFFKELGMESQLLLDPSFGFSKTNEQNWDLIYNFSFLLKELNALGIMNPIVLGLSKKRFLRAKLGVSDPNQSEGLHGELIKKLSHSTLPNHRQLIFRVHDCSLTSGLS